MRALKMPEGIEGQLNHLSGLYAQLQLAFLIRWLAVGQGSRVALSGPASLPLLRN